jgi:tripartite-type tricarboxylate transporter receptor subunit TctC
MMHVFVRVALALACLAASALAAAQSGHYPNRPIRMVVPFAPGGASDFVGRILQPKMSELLGQQVVIDNRAGASGNIGVELAARSPADGHTMILGNVGTMAINPAMFPKFPVNPVRDLIGISLLVDVPGAFAVHPSVPAKSVPEFIQYAKSRAGQLNYGSSGAGSAQRLAFEFLMLKSGIKLVHVPYKGGAGPATAAVLAGEVCCTMVTVASFIPHVKSGRARVLAVMAPKRADSLPDVPTMSEAGFPELTLGSWQGMYVPVGTPRPIVAQLYQVLMKTMNDPETARRLHIGGAEIVTSKSSEEFAGFMKSQNAFWAKIVKDVGAVAE